MNYKFINLKQPEKACLHFKSFILWSMYYRKSSSSKLQMLLCN